MRFAVFTVSTPEYSPEEALPVFKDLGYDGVEWRVVDQEPAPSNRPGFWAGNRCTLPLSTFVDEAPRIRALTEQAGLAIVNVGAYAMCDDLPGVEQVLKGTQLLGAPSARVRVPHYDGSQSYTKQRVQAQAQFKDVEALARQYGVRAVVETHPGTITPSASALAWFLEPFDPELIGALWDPGNMVHEGFEHYRIGLEALGSYLAHVQIKNATWREVGRRPDGSSNWRTEWVPLNRGIVNIADVLGALNTVGYDGWISFEDFSTDQPTVDRLRDNLAYVTSVLRASSAA